MSCSLVAKGTEPFHHFMCNACAGIPRLDLGVDAWLAAATVLHALEREVGALVQVEGGLHAAVLGRRVIGIMKCCIVYSMSVSEKASTTFVPC
jgi:hypothetical protein